jgi:hypothetical protein
MWRALVVIALLLPILHAEEKKALLTVPKLTQPAPKIDGKLDDAAWKDAAVSDPFRRAFGADSETPCTFKIMQDEKTLYIGIECVETETVIKNLKAVVDKHDGDPIWDDDEIEIFIDPAGSRKYPYYQIIINSKGTTFDVVMKARKEPDKSWEPKYESKVFVDKDRWSVELALPFAIFDRTEKSNETWVFNALHVRSVGEMLYWSPVGSNESHSPWAFGVLKGMPVGEMKK